MMNLYPIFFCDGLFGWGDRALPIKYWEGCFEANQQIKTFQNTFYFSYVTAQTKPGRFGGPSHYPELYMNPALLISSVYIGRAREFEQPPIAGWGAKDLVIEKWVENDGLVSSISQRYPFTAGNHPVIAEGIHRHVEFDPGAGTGKRLKTKTVGPGITATLFSEFSANRL